MTAATPDAAATTTLTCHCGSTRIELPRAPEGATQCTCTYCTKTGGLWAYYDVDELRVVSDDHGAVYSPTNPLHEHHICTRCGCTTYGVTPDYSQETLETGLMPEGRKAGVNVKLLDDYAMLTALPVETIDGRNLW
ncbi:MAG: hypothetical protein KDA37_13475 [Planctomycetales bacterium]|nr:hypothetical protein [Planctomycetales bacterium]